MSEIARTQRAGINRGGAAGFPEEYEVKFELVGIPLARLGKTALISALRGHICKGSLAMLAWDSQPTK